MLACWSCRRGDVNFVILKNGEVINCGHVQKGRKREGSPGLDRGGAGDRQLSRMRRVQLRVCHTCQAALQGDPCLASVDLCMSGDDWTKSTAELGEAAPQHARRLGFPDHAGPGTL